MAELEHVDLPSGAWVKLRDPDDTTEAQRRPATRLQTRIGLDVALRAVFEAQDGKKKAAASQADLSDAQLDLMADYMDATIIALVDSWSFIAKGTGVGEVPPVPVPLTVAGLRSISGKKDYEALAMACSKHRDALFPSFEVDPDHSSPTVASEGSERTSEASGSAVTSPTPGAVTSS
jgi:hypothetical protein